MHQAVGRQKLAQAKGAFCAPAGLGNEFPNNTSAESAADNQQEKIMSQSLSQLYIHSVSQSSIDAVLKYIENQENHHKTLSFKEELKKLLLAYKINYDEKYL